MVFVPILRNLLQGCGRIRDSLLQLFLECSKLPANRVVEVNEMWRVRQKEMDLDERLSDGSRGEKNSNKSTIDRYTSESCRSASKRLAVHMDDARPSCSSSNLNEDDGGLKDEEIEEFLQSRAKRGRGAIGSRMDETGPYRPLGEDTMDALRTSTVKSRRTVLGPEKPSSLKSSESSEDESDEDRRKKARKTKRSTKDKSRDRKRKRKEEKRRKKHR
ncbi:hypothetical protein LINGRAHAP2_LOCUS26056 [Linum grandiflorum]